MNNDYLWDGTGDPDPDVQRLEGVLRPLRHDERPLDLGRARRPATAHRQFWRWVPVALAAAALVVAAVLLRPWAANTPTGWSLEVSPAGTLVDGTAGSVGAGLPDGTRIEAGQAGRVRLRAPGVGTLELGAGSVLRVVRLDGGRHWFALDRGVLDADISAAPGIFAVDTPGVRAVDLGCRYRLDVGTNGEGRLHVTLGWVALERRGRESLVPAGALCPFRQGEGPGTPYFEGATPAFVDALAALDSGDSAARASALDVVLRDARGIDGLTLWHLLTRLDGTNLDRVFDRLERIMPAPAGVSKDLIRGQDERALAAWWTAIGLGDLAELRAGLQRVR